MFVHRLPFRMSVLLLVRLFACRSQASMLIFHPRKASQIFGAMMSLLPPLIGSKAATSENTKPLNMRVYSRVRYSGGNAHVLVEIELQKDDNVSHPERVRC